MCGRPRCATAAAPVVDVRSLFEEQAIPFMDQLYAAGLRMTAREDSFAQLKRLCPM